MTIFRSFFALFCLALVGIQPIWGQKGETLKMCGVHQHASNIPQGYRGELIQDRFGNLYTLEEIYSQQTGGAAGGATAAMTTCTAGIFHLNFMGTFPSDEEQTVCQVFNDLSALIAGAATTPVPINIIREPMSYGAPATATDFFMVNCGLANSTVLQIIATGQSPLPPGVAAGVVHIRERPTQTTTWHSLQDDVNPINTTEYDLYTATMHEALHIAGFASLIGLDGTPLGSGTVYSNWDRFLYSTSLQEHLIEIDPTGSCCNSHAFNNPAFPNMPQPLIGGCSINITFWNGTNALAPVNNVSLTPVNDNDMANKLSHLDISCGTEQYVMHPSISPGTTRRNITGAEHRILCNLGYSAVGGCDACLVIAQDDEIPTPIIMAGQGANNPMLIPFNTIVSNDVVPGGATPQLKANCGNTGGITVTAQANGFLVTGTAPGIWTFCYTLSGCGGTCDEAEVEVIVQSSVVETDCHLPNCELVCFGDFEDFVPGTNVYHQQLGVPNFFVQGSANSDNSVDIWDDGNGNQVLRWVRIPTGSWECARVPLAAPIQPGCSITVHYDAAAGPFGGTTPPNPAPLIYMTGLSGPPCPSIIEPILAGQYAVCGGVQAASIDARNVPFFPGNTGINNLQPVNFTWVNNTAFPITDVLIYGYRGPDAAAGYQFFLDNLSIIDSCCSACDPIVTIEPTTRREVCIGGQINIRYQVCVDPLPAAGTTVTLEPQIPNIPGLSLVPGGGFNANGVAVVTLPDNVGDPACAEVTLTLNVGTNFTPGTIIHIPMEAYASNGCIDEVTFNGGDVAIELIDCDTCDIEVRKDCRQRTDGSWYAQVQLFHNGLPIQNVNDPHCCVTWEYLNGIPTIPCPRPSGMPDMNFTPMGIAEGRHYKVTIVCDDCTYVEEGVISCRPGEPGGGGKKGNPSLPTWPQTNEDPGDLVLIYPNPAQNHIGIKLQTQALDLESYNFELYDAYGRKVLNHSMADQSQWQIMDVSSFPSGVYAWRLVGQQSESIIEMGKILITK